MDKATGQRILCERVILNSGFSVPDLFGDYLVFCEGREVVGFEIPTERPAWRAPLKGRGASLLAVNDDLLVPVDDAIVCSCRAQSYFGSPFTTRSALSR